MMGSRQKVFVNIVKDNFLDDFDDDGALMYVNYDAVVDQIYNMMKDNVWSRNKLIQRYVENAKCKPINDC